MARKSSRWKTSLLGPGAFLVRLLLRTLGSTLRYVVAKQERLERVLAARHPVVVSFWHDQIFCGAWFLYRDLHRRGRSITLLASHSRDGELMVRMVRPWKIRVVRGSASRGGRQAILGLYRELVDHRSSPLVIPDGPRGPAHVCKLGSLLLAKMAKVPVLPIAFVPERCWRIGSWDRMSVPKPWSRIAVAVGEPIHVGRGASSGELEELGVGLGARLEELTAEARNVLAS